MILLLSLFLFHAAVEAGTAVIFGIPEVEFMSSNGPCRQGRLRPLRTTPKAYYISQWGGRQFLRLQGLSRCSNAEVFCEAENAQIHCRVLVLSLVCV